MKDSPHLTPESRFGTRRGLKPGAAFLFLAFLLVLASPTTAPAQDARAPTPAREGGARGAITGRVVTEDGQALPHVRVAIFRMGAPASVPATALSDGEGKFSFGNLAPGSYYLNIFVPGYTPEPAHAANPSARTYYRVGDHVTLRMLKGGVITGTVSNANGDPLVGVVVVAVRVRLPDGRTVSEVGAGGQPRQTDDRGIYRIYGLRPGTYIVRAGGRGFFGRPTAYDADAPTYHPSTPRDAAEEVVVHAGQEMTGIDIRYRGEPGHAVSGTVSGALPTDLSVPGTTVLISLRHVSASAPEFLTSVQPGALNHEFSFDAVADGDYDIMARTTSPRAADLAAGTPRRVTVRGADVTGVNLTLASLASVSGQLLFEGAPRSPGGKTACQPARQPRPEEMIIFASRDEAGASTQNFLFFPGANDSAPDAKGIFLVRNLQAGLYRLGVRLPGDDFYVRAITLTNTPATTPAVKTVSATAAAAPPARATPPAQAASDAARGSLSLQAGERLTGINIHVAAGAASLRGRVTSPTTTTTADDAAPPDAQTLRAYLVPAETEQADHVLRYAETPIGADGTYAFANLAPGRYRLVARRASDREQASGAPRPLAWDAAMRTALRREAESVNVVIELAPCQRIGDYLSPSPVK